MSKCNNCQSNPCRCEAIRKASRELREKLDKYQRDSQKKIDDFDREMERKKKNN